MISSKINITVLGIGAIGGYYGGKLANHYAGSEKININFFSRRENENAIRENGLKLITSDGEKIIRPHLVSSHASEIGISDFIIICVKSFDLENAIETIKPCVGSNTVILPLLNGVDAHERIKLILTETEIWNGCVYLVSRLIEPGVVKESGTINHLYFGSNNALKHKLKSFEEIFKTANIRITLSDNILEKIWEKFLFISPLASATSFYDKPVGEILRNEESKDVLFTLISELITVATANGIIFSDDIKNITIKKITSLPFETTSSMHSDFQKGFKTEVDSLTGFVSRLANKFNIQTPAYNKVLAVLKEKQKRIIKF